MIVFIILLIIAAVQLSLGAIDEAYNTVVYSFYALIVAIVLQIASHVKIEIVKEGEEEPKVVKEPIPPLWTKWDRRKKILAISLASLVVLSAGAGLYFFYPKVQSTLFNENYPPLTVNLSFKNALKEPDGSVVLVFGLSLTGGKPPFKFVATWSDGFVQNGTDGVFSRTIVNSILPSYVNATVISSDGQKVTITVQMPKP